jgi:putative transposase
MLDDVAHYPRDRFPRAIISHAVCPYYRFTLSFRDVEDLLAQRGITVSYESIRHWCETFGAEATPNVAVTTLT